MVMYVLFKHFLLFCLPPLNILYLDNSKIICCSTKLGDKNVSGATSSGHTWPYAVSQMNGGERI